MKPPSKFIAETQLQGTIGGSRHKLVQSLIFDMACQLGSAICFKCKLTIETVSTLSIEHKQPWLHAENPKKLYHDLNNIAFSHRACNKQERHIQPRYRSGPLGTSWCCTCKNYLSFQSFHKNRSRWNGYASECIKCDRGADLRVNHAKKPK